MKRLLIMAALLFHSAAAYAAVRGEIVAYKHGDVQLKGYISYDEALTTKRPAVLVVHEWKGLGSYAKRRADQLAEMGYVAFAADMYGKDIRPQTHEEAGKQAGIYKNDRQLMRSRIQAALDVLKAHPWVDASKVGAIGYCFGGTTVLELARSGADVKGVVSFHGALETPDPADAKNIKGKILVQHGADDPFVKPEEVAAFKKEMADASVDMRFESYAGAAHSFTVPEANNPPYMAYNEEADKKSWESMKAFFREIFGE